MSDYELRFGGLARLYGSEALSRLRNAHVAVIGIGGVGSWVIEALARSGVGNLTLVDLDEVCVSNVNRQLPALQGTIGRSKAQVMAERIRSIQPEATVHAIEEFLTAESADRLLDNFRSAGGSWVVDAIDSGLNKCRLVMGCRKRNLSLIVCGAAGGRQDPTQIRLADLAKVTHDRLLSDLRKRLRQEPDFPGNRKSWGIPAVYSPESPTLPSSPQDACSKDGSPATDRESPRLNCQQGYGSAAFVTGGFGFVAAGYVVGKLAKCV